MRINARLILRMRTRLKTTTTTLASGTKVKRTTLVKAPVLEWRLQAAGCRALKAMPEFDRQFTFAGDYNAGRRSPQESVKAKATGLTPGETDLRIYGERARLLLIEMKGEKTAVSKDQKDRHALLRRLGYTVEVVRVSSEEESAERVVNLVRGWLAAGAAANDNMARAA